MFANSRILSKDKKLKGFNKNSDSFYSKNNWDLIKQFEIIKINDTEMKAFWRIKASKIVYLFLVCETFLY